MKKNKQDKEEFAEDFCFVCKDGGYLRVCDFGRCLKAYHPICVQKDETFLEGDDNWTCGLHSCQICVKSSSYQCFCCPTSFCEACITSGGFIQCKQGMGFCTNCLRLAKLIEEDRQFDSDGEEVDFDDTETYEYLFKDYWEIIKDREGLTIKDVQTADALLKRGEISHGGLNIDNDIEDDEWKLEKEEDAGFGDNQKLKTKRGKHSAKPPNGKSKKRKAFNGWASEELHAFLSSIGKYSNDPLSQLDVTQIVKAYVESNELFQGNKKNKNQVIPDDKLYPLFRRKKIKYHKIFESLKCHLAQFDGIDELFLSSEEDQPLSDKKLKLTGLGNKSSRPDPIKIKEAPEQPKSLYAAIVKDNIKLMYLRKSLVLELLVKFEAEFEIFEDKVVGCFVKVKHDPKDYYFLVQKPNQIGQVTGIKKTEQVYKVEERNVNIVLRVSSVSRDVKISMLSDDDVEEDDCKDLRDLVKRGLFKQPLTEDLERKIKSVHEDIENHSINKELTSLGNKIERANEKGWRKELDEYINRRELLGTPEEKMRRLSTIPPIVPYKEDTEANTVVPSNLHVVIKGKSEIATTRLIEKCAETKSQDKAEIAITSPIEKCAETKAQEIEVKAERKEEKVATNINEEIIEVDDDDEDDDVIVVDDGEGKENNKLDANIDFEKFNKVLWRYRDPSGAVQGPFALHLFRHWQLYGYFDDYFKVWKDGQLEKDAVFLNDALRAVLL